MDDSQNTAQPGEAPEEELISITPTFDKLSPEDQLYIHFAAAYIFQEEQKYASKLEELSTPEMLDKYKTMIDEQHKKEFEEFKVEEAAARESAAKSAGQIQYLGVVNSPPNPDKSLP